jgi:hypothetical protein
MLKDKGAFLRHGKEALYRLTRIAVYITHLLEGHRSTGTAHVGMHAIRKVSVNA